MTEVIEVAKAISEVGMLALCAAFVIWFAIHQVNKEKKEKEKLQELEEKRAQEEIKREAERENIINNQYNKLIDTLQSNNQEMMRHFVDQVNTHVPSTEENRSLTVLNSKIDDSLQELLDKLDANRVTLIQYHNGARNLNKTSFLKMSITNERVKLGTKPLMLEFKDQFRGVLTYIVDALDIEGKCYLPDIEVLKTKDAGTYEFLALRGVKSQYVAAIKNDDDLVVGFISVVYENKISVKESSIKEELSKHKERIQTLLNLEKDKDYIR